MIPIGRHRMPIPAIRFRVDFGRRQAVGPGKIALLERIGQRGSLSQAARDLHMSYRRAWLLLESLNASFRERVAVSSRGGRGGGGMRLTAFGLRGADADARRAHVPANRGQGPRGSRRRNQRETPPPLRGPRRTGTQAPGSLRDAPRDARKPTVRKSVGSE